MTQLILRGAGFKSSEMTTLVREMEGQAGKTSVHIQIRRKENDLDLMSQIGIGIVNYPFTEAQEKWERWVELAYLSIVKNFQEWQKKSIAYTSIENILTSLEKTGFTIIDAPINETFDIAKQVH